MEAKILIAFASGCAITSTALWERNAMISLSINFLMFVLGYLSARAFLNEWKDAIAERWSGYTTGAKGGLWGIADEILRIVKPPSKKAKLRIGRSSNEVVELPAREGKSAAVAGNSVVRAGAHGHQIFRRSSAGDDHEENEAGTTDRVRNSLLSQRTPAAAELDNLAASL